MLSLNKFAGIFHKIAKSMFSARNCHTELSVIWLVLVFEWHLVVAPSCFKLIFCGCSFLGGLIYHNVA